MVVYCCQMCYFSALNISLGFEGSPSCPTPFPHSWRLTRPSTSGGHCPMVWVELQSRCLPPTVTHVFFNGAGAGRAFARHFPELRRVPQTVLPSSSGAKRSGHPTNGFRHPHSVGPLSQMSLHRHLFLKLLPSTHQISGGLWGQRADAERRADRWAAALMACQDTVPPK